MSRPLAFLFDIDGTLIDSAGAGGGALLDALSHEFNVKDPQMVRLHGRTDLGIISELLENHGIEPTRSAFEQLCQGYFARLPAELAKRDRGSVLPGVFELLNELVELERHSLGILTGNMPTSAQAKLTHFDLDQYFAFGIYGDAAAERPGLSEPAIQAVQEEQSRLNRTPLETEQIIIIGDTPLDVELALTMNARCLAVCTGGFEAAELETAGANWVVDDLSDTNRILQLLAN